MGHTQRRTKGGLDATIDAVVFEEPALYVLNLRLRS